MNDNFLIEGRNPVLEALKAGKSIEKIYVQKGEKQGSIVKIINMAQKGKIPVTEIDKSKINEMSETKSHQGVIAAMSPIEYVTVEDIIETAKKKNEPLFVIILDEIEDPHNLGSIIRTANAAGVHGVIIPKHRNAPVTSTVVKTSAGACFHTPIAKVTNLVRTMKQLKEAGVWFTAADMNGEKNIYDADFSGAVGIVIGNEGKGISRLVKEECDFLVNIPMMGKIESLNASVSAGIFMYRVLNTRMKWGIRNESCYYCFR